MATACAHREFNASPHIHTSNPFSDCVRITADLSFLFSLLSSLIIRLHRPCESCGGGLGCDGTQK